MGTHRIGWRPAAVRTLVAAALMGQAPFAAAVEDCAAIKDAAAQSACIDRLASDSTAAEVVHSSIVLLDRRPGGELVFRLANGQTWVQQVARFIAVEAGERVIIAPARLGGGHILATERSATTRVRRLVEPSAGEREGSPLAGKSPQPGSARGRPSQERASAGEREGNPLAVNGPKSA